MSARAALAQTFQGVNGHWSTMRIVTMLTCVVVLGMWVAFCFMEGRLIPIAGKW